MNFRKSKTCIIIASLLASHSALAAGAKGYLGGTYNNRSEQLYSKQSSDPVMLKGQYDEEFSTQTFLWNKGGVANIPLDKGLPLEPQYSKSINHYFSQVATSHGANKQAVTSSQKSWLHNTGRGGIIAKYQQRVDGVEVFGRYINIVINRENELVASSGYFSPAKKSIQSQFNLSAADVLKVAINKHIESPKSEIELQGIDYNIVKGNGYSRLQNGLQLNDVVLSNNSRAKKVYFPLGTEQLVPAYYVEVETSKRGKRQSKFYSYVIHAASGEVLFENNLTSHVATTYKVFAETSGQMIPFDGPHGNDLTPHPTGDINDTPEIASSFVNENTVTLDHAGLSTGDPWLTASETTTAGNNVDAYADISGENGFDDADVRPGFTSANAFEYDFATFSDGLTGDAQKHAVVNLFYVNNFLHDWFYDSGFNEAAGNAQNNNFARGGLANDRLLVEAQDSSGTNNANMATPSDGGNPRMQMFLWTFLSNAEITIAGVNNIETRAASFGPEEYDVTGVMSLVDDQTATIGDGCESIVTDLTNKIAIIDRGDCNFTVKVKNAQDQGAVGVIMVNNVSGDPIVQGGEDDTVTIPSMMVTLEKGDEIKAALSADDTLQARLSNEARPLDGTLDNGIVAHEWGHYLSNRLVGNANGLTNNQGRSMGEGWSDFVALLMTTKESDNLVVGNENFQGVYSASTFIGDAYDGIRRAPYSTDMTKNALTFKHIEEGVSLPLSHPISFGVSGASNAAVHQTGEIWANTLWEVYVGLINKPGNSFSEAQTQMKDYLVASLKLTPSQPTLLEARDALLAAALANDAEDFEIIRNAFAKRGMGANAAAPDRNSGGHLGVVEDFTTGIDLKASMAFDRASIDLNSCDEDGVLDNNETATLVLTLENYSAADIPSFNITLDADPSMAVASNINVPAMTGFGASQTVTTEVAVNSASFMQDLTITATFDEIGATDNAFSEPQPIDFTFTGNFDLSATANSDDMNSSQLSLLDWTVEADNGLVPFTVRNGLWHGEDSGSGGSSSLTSPEINIASSDDLVVSFDHFFKFETSEDDPGVFQHWDGGVIEVSMDGGAWTDVTAFGASLSEPYNGTIEASNVTLSGRSAYVDTRSSRDLTNNQITFPAAVLTGSSLRIRFLIGTDSNTGEFGWQIDNFAVTNAAAPMFSEAVVENNSCPSATRPVVDAGTDSVVISRDSNDITVNLSGVASDPNGDALTLSWTQLSGPSVTISNSDNLNASFVAASPTADTDYVFQLTADDGSESTSDDVMVSINPNQAPVVTVNSSSVNEGARFTFSATSSDNEGDSLTYTWSQTAGPNVSLTNADSLTPSFTAPDVSSNTPVSFELVANDGSLDSNVATATITINDVPESSSGGGGSLSIIGVLMLALTRLTRLSISQNRKHY